MVLIWFVGDVFSEPLLDVVDFIGRYRWIFTAVTVAVVLVSVIRARQRHRSEIETVEEIAAELESDGLAAEPDRPTTSTSETSPPAHPE
jgi:hypothetical protein